MVEIVEKEIELVEGQAELLKDFHSPILAGIAGTGGGKTILGYWWLYTRMMAYPGNTWLLAEPTYPMLSKVILESSDPGRPSLYDFFLNVGHHPRYRAVDRILYTDYGKVYLGSADNPNSMQGAAVRGVWLDEAGQMSLLAHETAFQRRSMLKGQELITTTPYDLGWLLHDIVEKAGRDIHVERWSSVDRPGFPRESYENAKRTLPPWRFRMLYDAQFERPAGLIYHMFDERACLLPRSPIQGHWEVYVGHDFGPDNPGALFYALNPDTGNFRLFAEYLPGTGIPVNKQVDNFNKITNGMSVIRRVGGAHGEQQIRELYSAHGWHIIEPKITGPGSIETQILKVQSMHQLNKIEVMDDCVHYLDEKRTFSRQLGDDNQPTEKIANESRYHLMAAERYIMSEFVPETVSSGESVVVARRR